MKIDVDDSCRKPGAVPFKWEVIPGVPKNQQQEEEKMVLVITKPLPKVRVRENIRKFPSPKVQPQPLPPPLMSPTTSFLHGRSPSPSPRHQPRSPFSSSSAHQQQTQTSQKLKLKPSPAMVAKSYPLPPPSEPRSYSFRSNPRSRSERWRFDHSNNRLRPEIVSTGCFLGPWFRRKEKGCKKRVTLPPTYDDCCSELETPARWSLSSRKSSFSPFRSPLSYSSSSYFSSPRPGGGGDSEWAGYGLF